MTEAAFYNVLTLALKSDYSKIAAQKERHGSWSRAWENLGPGLRAGLSPETEWMKLQNNGVNLTLIEENSYPSLLKEIPLPPFGLYARGAHPKGKFALAVVGTRKATLEGRSTAKKFASTLARSGATIVSGLALGIDAAAHEGCLEAQGQTVAVLANGLDRFYPATNEGLASRILKSGGALVSEYPLGAEPLPYRFLERNRIVSGLARGTLIIEAPKESGALTTARFALDQNREVFVLPGPAAHPNFFGSHRLVRAGATLVTSPEEILEELGFSAGESTEPGAAGLSPEEKLVYEALKNSGRALNVDNLSEICNLEVSAVNRNLSFLTVKRLIKETEQGYTLL